MSDDLAMDKYAEQSSVLTGMAGNAVGGVTMGTCTQTYGGWWTVALMFDHHIREIRILSRDSSGLYILNLN